MNRLYQTHALIYLIGISIIILLFVVIQIVNTIDCACLRRKCQLRKDRRSSLALYGLTYSNNIYKELSVEDLRTEYKKTKTDYTDYRFLLDKHFLSGQTVDAFMKRLRAKLREIKEFIRGKLGEEGIQGLEDTMVAF